VLEFLDIDATYQPDTFRRFNTSLAPRSLLVSRLTAGIPRRASPRGPLDHIVLPLGRVVRRLNRRRAERVPMDETIRLQLREELAGDVSRLSALLGRDLGGFWWGEGERASARGSGVATSSGMASAGPVEKA
jgi:hypothetical protein